MKELTEIFSDPKELGIARRILSVVPTEVGSYPIECHWNMVTGLVDKAYEKELSEIGHGIDRREMIEYCRDNILPKLKQAGLVKEAGAVFGVTLYIKL